MKWLSENPPCVIIMEADKFDKKEMNSLMVENGFEIASKDVDAKNFNLIYMHSSCDADMET